MAQVHKYSQILIFIQLVIVVILQLDYALVMSQLIIQHLYTPANKIYEPFVLLVAGYT